MIIRTSLKEVVVMFVPAEPLLFERTLMGVLVPAGPLCSDRGKDGICRYRDQHRTTDSALPHQ